MVIEYKELDFGELSIEQQRCVVASQHATELSYSPYSEFKVGAVGLLSTGELVSASNQENVSFTAGICAERALIYSRECLENKVVLIAISACKDGHFVDCSPCGVCRQSLVEVELKQKSNIKLIFMHNNKYIVVDSVKSLLPFAFEF